MAIQDRSRSADAGSRRRTIRRCPVLEASKDDNVQVTGEEIALLKRLRKSRNDAVHGRSASLPTAEDIQHGYAIVSRMLTYRLAKLEGNARGRDPSFEH
jgi:hypothetical protein